MTTLFAAMGTEVRLELPRPENDPAGIVQLFAALEQRFSRFRPDSELSRLNAALGPTQVSRCMCEALLRAQRFAELTGGLFDPGIGSALVGHGYDRSFTPGALDRVAAPAPTRAGSVRDLAIDAGSGIVLRPPHVWIDLGGMIKGHAVDRAAAQLGPGALVDAGGDAALTGEPAPGAPWIVDLEDPTDPRRVLLSLAVRDRAVATSAANRRTWRLGRRRAHHLIDPRTGAPARSDLEQVTVIAEHAELAEVIAKAIFVAGSRGAERLLATVPDAAAVLVRSDGALGLLGELEVVDAA